MAFVQKPITPAGYLIPSPRISIRGKKKRIFVLKTTQNPSGVFHSITTDFNPWHSGTQLPPQRPPVATQPRPDPLPTLSRPCLDAAPMELRRNAIGKPYVRHRNSICAPQQSHQCYTLIRYTIRTA